MDVLPGGPDPGASHLDIGGPGFQKSIGSRVR
jgi:hypothetical protein